jgi:hypothetical protein
MDKQIEINDINMSVCNFEVSLDNIKITFAELLKILKPNHQMISVNSNFLHQYSKGYEEYIFKKKKSKKRKNTNRKKQGDGSSFNSAIHVKFRVKAFNNTYGIYNTKIFVKEQGGATLRISGVKDINCRDGIKVAKLWVKYLNDKILPIHIGNTKFDKVFIQKYNVVMMNFNFCVIYDTDKFLLLKHVANTLINLKFLGDYEIMDVIPPLEITKISILFKNDREDYIRVFIFMTGKIIILGIKEQKKDAINLKNEITKLIFAKSNYYIRDRL